MNLETISNIMSPLTIYQSQFLFSQNIYLSPPFRSAFCPLNNILKYALCKAHSSLSQQPLMTAKASETRDFALLVFLSNLGHLTSQFWQFSTQQVKFTTRKQPL